MRHKVGAEQLEQVPPLAHRPDGVFRSAGVAPVGPTHAVDATSGAVACGSTTEGREVLDQDWEEAFFIENCAGCFATVVTQHSAGRHHHQGQTGLERAGGRREVSRRASG